MLRFCGPRELCILVSSCRALKEIASQNTLWESHFISKKQQLEKKKTATTDQPIKPEKSGKLSYLKESGAVSKNIPMAIRRASAPEVNQPAFKERYLQLLRAERTNALRAAIKAKLQPIASPGSLRFPSSLALLALLRLSFTVVLNPAFEEDARTISRTAKFSAPLRARSLSFEQRPPAQVHNFSFGTSGDTKSKAQPASNGVPVPAVSHLALELRVEPKPSLSAQQLSSIRVVAHSAALCTSFLVLYVSLRGWSPVGQKSDKQANLASLRLYTPATISSIATTHNINASTACIVAGFFGASVSSLAPACELSFLSLSFPHLHLFSLLPLSLPPPLQASDRLPNALAISLVAPLRQSTATTSTSQNLVVTSSIESKSKNIRNLDRKSFGAEPVEEKNVWPGLAASASVSLACLVRNGRGELFHEFETCVLFKREEALVRGSRPGHSMYAFGPQPRRLRAEPLSAPLFEHTVSRGRGGLERPLPPMRDRSKAFGAGDDQYKWKADEDEAKLQLTGRDLLDSPWRTELFNGVLLRCVQVDFALWDERNQPVWAFCGWALLQPARSAEAVDFSTEQACERLAAELRTEAGFITFELVKVQHEWWLSNFCAYLFD